MKIKNSGMCIKSKPEEDTGKKFSNATIPTSSKNKIKMFNILKLQIPGILSSKFLSLFKNWPKKYQWRQCCWQLTTICQQVQFCEAKRYERKVFFWFGRSEFLPNSKNVNNDCQAKQNATL
jgi:hypothetical protein